VCDVQPLVLAVSLKHWHVCVTESFSNNNSELVCVYVIQNICVWQRESVCQSKCDYVTCSRHRWYRVATISRLLKIIGLFGRISSLL